MPIEIERKFLVKKDLWNKKRKHLDHTFIRQGYLNRNAERTVRVRVRDNNGFLTVKGKNEGISRKEFEYDIPLKDAKQLLELCEGGLIEKRRYTLSYDGMLWEIDEFFGDNEGLIIAELELEDEKESFSLPEWIEKEVSTDNRYYNSNLIKEPFNKW